MGPLAGTGAVIVVLALAMHSIGVAAEQRRRTVSSGVLRILAAGVVLDITATALMGLATTKGPFTIHGFVGYTSLAGMPAANWLLWRFASAHAPDTRVPRSLHVFVRCAYFCWVAAFFTGAWLGIRG